MRDIALHEQLSYYFRSTLFQPALSFKILHSYKQFWTAIYMAVHNFVQLHINLEISR